MTAPAATARPAPVLRPLAVAGGALIAVAATTATALHVAGSGSAVARGVTDWWLMGVTGSLSFGLTGTWAALRRPRSAVGWVLLGIGAVGAVGGAALEWGVRSVEHDLPLGAAALWLGNWTWAAMLVAIGALLPLLLPDGRLPSRRWRPALALSVAAVLLMSVEWALTPYDPLYPSLVRAGAENPLGTSAADSPLLGVPVLVTCVLAVVLAMTSLVVRWRRARGEERQQLKWVLAGGVLTLVLFALGFAAGPVVSALALVPIPAACLLAALRYGLWDVDVVISRALVYAALTGAVVLVYVAAVGVLGGLLGRSTGAPLVATALVAVAASPLHRRLQDAVNRLVHGDRDEPYAVLRRLGARLDAASATEHVLPEVVDAVARALRAPYAAIALADGDVVERGTASGAVERLPLTYGGVEVGELRVQAAGRQLGRGDRRALADLAGSAAVAVHTVLLSRDLRRSREEAVAAREEERRRLYHDLHDELGPSLAALALQVETARDLVAPGPAQAILDRVHGRLTTTVTDVRTVVHGLRPPVLDDLGLAEALRERFGHPVLVDVRDADDLPAAVEVAAYAIASEAVHNALRHGAPTRVDVVVRRDGGDLVVAVTDDGSGLAPGRRPGIGLESMRRRAEELGGALAVTSAGGVRVEARIPA